MSTWKINAENSLFFIQIQHLSNFDQPAQVLSRRTPFPSLPTASVLPFHHPTLVHFTSPLPQLSSRTWQELHPEQFPLTNIWILSFLWYLLVLIKSTSFGSNLFSAEKRELELRYFRLDVENVAGGTV